MSKATKRKHVTKEVLDDYILPTENQQIVKVVAGKGNNLHEIETPTEEKFLVSMPTRFRKNVWIKRGDFVIIDPIEEGERVKGEITAILMKDQIKYIQEEGKWPVQFRENLSTNKDEMIPEDLLPPSDEDSDEEREITVVNANRQNIVEYVESDSDEEEEEETENG